MVPVAAISKSIAGVHLKGASAFLPVFRATQKMTHFVINFSTYQHIKFILISVVDIT